MSNIYKFISGRVSNILKLLEVNQAIFAWSLMTTYRDLHLSLHVDLFSLKSEDLQELLTDT